MPTLPKPTRLLPLLAALAAFALPASGCGTSSADPERGRELFLQKCSGCHGMAEAGSTAQNGPNLDHAFAAARASGQGETTIEGIVEAQVEYPRPSNDNPAVSMPADLVQGQDLDDVAAYVAEYAGVPGIKAPRVPGGPGAQVFASKGCNGCHTLAEANAGGVTGPNLDEVLPGQSAAMIQKSIVDPNADITPGFPPELMPGDYEAQLSPEELEELVAFLAKATAKGGGGSK
ncbi:MAG TPA: c-type cytochrome [Solirubrobacterales bacterium]|nr:c-type cytochrome [Solirubrobacterales bacterium]